MKIIISRALRVLLATLVVASFAGIPAPVASADTSSLPDDTVLVPRITKGAHGPLMRVKRNSPEARIFFRTQSRSASGVNGNCPGTICPKTLTCTDTKGALGARCLTS